MRLFSFRIYNFKSIDDTGVIKVAEDDNITILAGQNEAGKSAVLEALDFFENGASADSFEETYRRVETHPRVECTYHFTKEELDNVEKKASKELRKYIEINGFTFVRGLTQSDDFDEIKYLNPSELSKLLGAVKAKQKAETPEGEEPDYYSFSPFFDERPKFIFYSGFDDYILPNKITYAELGENEAVSDFEKVFDIDFTALLDEPSAATRSRRISIVNKNASADLNEYWSQKLEDEPVTYSYNIDVNITSPQSSSSITFLTDQGDDRFLYFGQRSRGFRWFSSFNLKLRAHEADSENLDNFILLIDEPGQGLHEEAQKDAKRVLNEIAAKGMQIIFSTHQPQLLRDDSDIRLSRLKLVVKSKSEGTKVKNIAQQTSQAGYKDALSPIRTAMGMISLDATDILNGKQTVIVEGITDMYYIKAFLKLHKQKEVALVPCVGTPQVPNVYSILSGWGVSSKVIVDDDSAGSKAIRDITKALLGGMTPAEQDEIMYKNTGCKGIEDTFESSDFTSFADPFLHDKPAGKTNSELAKHNSSKEIIARTFLDKVMAGDIKLTSLSESTRNRIKDIVTFIG